MLTDEELVKMYGRYGRHLDCLRAVARAVTRAVAEECARECEREGQRWESDGIPEPMARLCAAAIRRAWGIEK